MLNPFIKNISGFGSASCRQESYLYDSQKAEQRASFLDLLFYLKRQSHTRALQLQAPVAHRSKGQLCTAERALSLLYFEIPVMFSWRMPLSFDSKQNVTNLTCSKAPWSNMRCSTLLPAVRTLWMWVDAQRSPSFVCASTSDHDLLSFYYLFEVSPFHKN